MPIGVIALAGKELFILVLGKNWGIAGAFTEILAFMLFAKFMLSPFILMLAITKKQHYETIVNTINFVLSLIILGIGGKFLPVESVLWLLSVFSGITFFSLMFMALNSCGVSMLTVLKRTALPFLSGGLVIIMIFLSGVYLCQYAFLIFSGSISLFYYFVLIKMKKLAIFTGRLD